MYNILINASEGIIIKINSIEFPNGEIAGFLKSTSTVASVCIFYSNVIGIISITDVLNSFGTEAMIAVVALIITVEPLKRTNFINFVSKYIIGGGRWFRISLIRMMILVKKFFNYKKVGIISAFLPNAQL